MRFEVLGPVRGWRGEEELQLGSPQQRLTLAALLLAEGRSLTVDQLVDIVWADEPPRTGAATVRTYLSRLRAVLGEGAIRSVGGAYGCSASLDASDFTTLVRQARQAPPAEAGDMLASALRLWHGEALAGLPGAWAEGQRARFAELRLSALEARIEADLTLGRHQYLVAELTELTRAHPARERLVGQLMLALYRSGRQSEAIGVYTDTTRFLARELGVAPSTDLAARYQQIISGDPALAASHRHAGERRPAPPVPCRLPPDIPDFTGRAAQTYSLLGALRATGRQAPPVVAVSGIGGVGKTTLAVRLAHALRQDYPDGQLYVDLRGADPAPLDPSSVLASFLHALGVGDERIPEGVQERSALFRSLLSDRRMLLVLDNARAAAQVTPLIPGSPGCAVLVTSRPKLPGLGGAHGVDLATLTPGEAVDLLARIVGHERVAAERAAAERLVALCAHLPLAIRVVGARLALSSLRTVESMLAELLDERGRLDALRAGELDVQSTFEMSYRQLTPAQARAFRLAAAPDCDDLPLDAAAELLALDEDESEHLLESLVDLSLLESPVPGRYRYHDLLKVYARRQPDPEREEAVDRLAGHLLATLQNACTAWGLGRSWSGSSPRPGLSFSGEEEASAWLETELAGIWPLLGQAADIHLAVRLLRLLEERVDRVVHHREFSGAAERLRQAAKDRGDRETGAGAACVLASVLYSMGRRADAEPLLREAVGQAADGILLAESGTLLALTIATRQDWPEAVRVARRAVATARRSGDPRVEARTLTYLSQILLRIGQAEEALGHTEAAIALAASVGVAAFEISIKGVVLTALGRYEEAIPCYAEALAAYRKQGLMQMALENASRLAAAYRQAGHPDLARKYEEEARALSQEIADSALLDPGPDGR
ncbi:BTAD domain-containing putative transcriptional regulator [Nonomuraea sp. NPDC004354]